MRNHSDMRISIHTCQWQGRNRKIGGTAAYPTPQFCIIIPGGVSTLKNHKYSTVPWSGRTYILISKVVKPRPLEHRGKYHRGSVHCTCPFESHYVQRSTKGYEELRRRIPLLTSSLLYISCITDASLVPKEHGKSRAHSYWLRVVRLWYLFLCNLNSS